MLPKGIPKCIEKKRELTSAVKDFKTEKSTELELQEKILKDTVQNEETKISKIIKGSITTCNSEDDVLMTMISNELDMAYHIRDLLRIFGMLTKQEILEKLEFQNNSKYKFAVRVFAGKLMKDNSFFDTYSIGQKKMLNDYYFYCLTDSERDMKLQEQLKEIDQMILDYRRNTPNYPTLNSTKPASAIKRGVAGMVIAGPAGAIIGVGSAINKNIIDKGEVK